MACEHAAKLGADYVGLFCIYGCKESVAELGAREGQLFLKRDAEQSFIAVVQGNKKQKIVQQIDEQPEDSSLKLTFAGGGAAEVSLPNVLLAFQGAEEVIELD